MNTLTKATLGAVAVALLSAGAASEANAAVSFGIGIGGPGYFGYGGYAGYGGRYGYRAPVRPYYDPCYRPYEPAYCGGYPAYGPAFINGYWGGPYHYYGRYGRPGFRAGWHGGYRRHR